MPESFKRKLYFFYGKEKRSILRILTAFNEKSYGLVKLKEKKIKKK
jgi:hypothetical protein